MSDLDIRKVLKIIKTLEKLETDSLLDTRLALKLALIEGCGWIEEKMHCMMFDYINRKVDDIVLRKKVESAIRETNYSFKYVDFKDKLVATLGEIEVLKMEHFIERYDTSYFDFDHFKSVLGELKKERDRCAHTYTRLYGTVGLGFSGIETRLKYINVGLNIFQNFIRRR